jgi:hypothetical protein
MVDQAALISVAKDFAVPIVAAVLGALLGYVPAALLARRSSKELLVRDAQQRRESELTEARRAFVKLTLLANTLGSYRDQIEAMVAKATADGNDHMTLSQRLSTFAGVEEEPIIEFDASELAPFIAAAKPEVVDALLLLQRRYAAVVQGLRAFARMKTELHFGLARVGETSRGPDLVSTTRAKVPLELSNIFRLKAQELE